MATQILPNEVLDLLWHRNIDVRSLLWNFNTTGDSVSLNLSWRTSSGYSINSHRDRHNYSAWESSHKFKKSPSTVRRDNERLKTFLQRKRHNPVSSEHHDIAGQQEANTQAQVSVHSVSMPESKISVGCQTDGVVSKDVTVQSEDATTSQDAGTQYELTTIVTDCFTQTSELPKSSIATQYVPPLPSQDVRQIQQEEKTEKFTVSDIVQALDGADFHEEAKFLNYANSISCDFENQTIHDLNSDHLVQIPRNPRPLRVAIIDYDEVGVFNPMALSYQDVVTLSRASGFLKNGIRLYKYTTHTRAATIENYLKRNTSIEDGLEGLYVNIHGKVFKVPSFTKLGQITTHPSGDLVIILRCD